MKEFVRIILGDASGPEFAAAMFFALLTAFAMLLYRTTKRDVASPRTPFEFSWSFLVSDNAMRILYTIIMIFLCVRFGQKWFDPEQLAYMGFLVGVAADKIAWVFEMISTWLEDLAKDKFKKAKP